MSPRNREVRDFGHFLKSKRRVSKDKPNQHPVFRINRVFGERVLISQGCRIDLVIGTSTWTKWRQCQTCCYEKKPEVVFDRYRHDSHVLLPRVSSICVALATRCSGAAFFVWHRLV